MTTKKAELVLEADVLKYEKKEFKGNTYGQANILVDGEFFVIVSDVDLTDYVGNECSLVCSLKQGKGNYIKLRVTNIE